MTPDQKPVLRVNNCSKKTSNCTFLSFEEYSDRNKSKNLVLSTHKYFDNLYTYKTERCVFVCLFVSIIFPNY